MTYRIAIEECVSEEFEIEADSVEEALDKAEWQYKAGELVLEPGSLVSKQMCCVGPTPTEWTLFY